MRESLKVKFGDLKNGLRYYGQYDWSGRTWVSGVGVMAGSIHDPRGKSGLAHVTEHLITSVSKKYPDLGENNALFRRHLGGRDDDANIFTNRTVTFYGHESLLYRRYMLKMLDILASFVHPNDRIIDPEMAKAELAAIHQEYYLRGVDIMDVFLEDHMHALMYEKNPARNRIDCNVDDLENITTGDVKRFLRRYYVPQNAFVVILGPRFQEVKNMAEKYFDDWESTGGEPGLDYDRSEDFPELKKIKQVEISRGAHQYHCGIGFPTEPYASPDRAAIEVLARVWEARLGRLRDDNREFNGGAYRHPVELSRSFVHGMIWAHIATTSNEFEEHAEEIILEETEKLRTDLVSHEELEAEKGKMLDEYRGAFRDSADDLAEMVIEAAANGDPDLVGLHDFRNSLEKVGRRRLRNIANKYFTKNYARVLIKPA